MIRPMEISDVPRVAEIHVFTWRSAYRGIISDDILFNHRSVSKSIERFSDFVRNGTHETYVFDDGIVKAFLTIGNCRDEDKTDAFELWAIYVDPFMQKQGIGTKFVNYCEEQAVKRGFDEVCIFDFEILFHFRPAHVFQ